MTISMAHDHRSGFVFPARRIPRRRNGAAMAAVGMLVLSVGIPRPRRAGARVPDHREARNVGVAAILKEVVDFAGRSDGDAGSALALLAAYGILRFSTTAVRGASDVVFVARDPARIRRVALTVFRHMHSLSLRFHLERHTGGVSRDIERRHARISTLLTYMLFSIVPVILEFAWWRSSSSLSSTALRGGHFCRGRGLHRLSACHHRVRMEIPASERAGSKATRGPIDSLLNYETVKYVNNEEYEARRYDENLQKYESAGGEERSFARLLTSDRSCIMPSR